MTRRCPLVEGCREWSRGRAPETVGRGDAAAQRGGEHRRRDADVAGDGLAEVSVADHEHHWGEM